MTEKLIWHVCIVDTCARKFICDDCEDHARGEHVCSECREKWDQLRRRIGTRTRGATVTIRSRRAGRDAQRSRILRGMR